MSAFTEPLAQILAALERDSEDPAAFAAFARVERLAADMETALERIARQDVPFPGTDRILNARDYEEIARAALATDRETEQT